MFFNKVNFQKILKPIFWLQSLSARSYCVRKTTNYEMSVKKRQRMMASDKVADCYEPIYNAPSGMFFRIGYPLGVVVSISGPVIYFYKYGVSPTTVEKTTTVFRKKVFFNEKDFYLIITGSLLFISSFLAILIKYPYRVYKHKNKMDYIAIFQSIIPFRTYHLYYSKACQTKFKNPLYFFVEDGQFKLGDKKAILMPYHFRTSYDLCQMIGVK